MSVDRQLRKTFATWRLQLGNDLVGREVVLTDDDRTALVDSTLERCLALRLAENRGIITTGTLAHWAECTDIHAHIDARCQQLFGPSHTTAMQAQFSDAAIGTIVRALGTPYRGDFAALSVDTLGAIREFFHDRPLRLNHERRVVEEARTGSRKASGSYYTPAPIVDYLVRQTLTPLLAEAASGVPRDITVLDPACGAGAFLLGAYHFLLDWHLTRYLAEPQRHAAMLTQGAEGSWQLTAAERRRILQGQLYGVDRDPHALETTRLTLLLQFHDGSADAAHEPPPDLSTNLRQGDTLVGPDICRAPRIENLTAAEHAALLPLDWHATFPAIMARGGFDAVIGNPPYLSYSGRQAVALLAPVRDYLRARYTRAGWPAAHAFFIEQAARQLARRRIAFVIPDQVGHLDGYAATRALLTGVIEVRYWGESVFAEAITPALTFIADKEYGGPLTIIERNGRAEAVDYVTGQPWRGSSDTALLTKLYSESESLGTLVGDIGVHTGNCARALIFPALDAPAGAVPILEGKEVGRYRCAAPDRAFQPDYRPKQGEYYSVRSEARYADAPFVIRQTASHPIVGPRHHATYFRNSLLALYSPTDGRAIEYLVGLLNSRLFQYLYATIVREGSQRAFPQVKIGTLRRLPIRRLDLSQPADRTQHDAIVTAVRQLLVLYERRDEATKTADCAGREGVIKESERSLDTLIYVIYGLTTDEIAIVENAGL